MPTRREQTSSESRQLLISAAAELFAEQGFRRTTFVDIAQRSGISRGSIPWHFGNKDGLLEAVVEEITESLIHAPPPGDNPAENLDELREFIRRPTTRLLITLTAEALEPDSPVHGFYAELHRTMRKWLKNWTEQMPLPAGVNRDDVVTVLTGAAIGIHQQWRVAPEEIDLDQTFAAFKAVFLKLQHD
ncbi:TetR family transcriptional regulator [Mycobacterium genavense]|uniref:TetR family transcriptional regulator n=1 Tax=Mycobacterium genavense TaxID=36812 RepID=UPI0004720B5E|nr:TetR family transcriptional regulator [Mycobacterium genavense]